MIARHSRFKDVKDAVATRAVKPPPSSAGESLDLEFAAPPVPEGLRRDLFLVSRGVYTGVSAERRAERTPVRFAARAEPA